jgi:ATP-dependent Clp protease ATP-binding subunit ClpC
MTRRRLLRLAVALYPSWWRRRYGDEAVAILEQTPPSGRGALDLLRGAVDAWTSQRPPDRPFARFDDGARQVIVQAQMEARALQHNYVGTEHVLLGLLTAGDGVAAQALANLGVSPERVRARLIEVVGQGGRGASSPPSACAHAPSPADLPKWSMCLTPRTKRGFEFSCRAADRLGDRDVESAHLLLGLLDEGEGIGPMILAELIEPARVREQLTVLGAR